MRGVAKFSKSLRRHAERSKVMDQDSSLRSRRSKAKSSQAKQSEARQCQAKRSAAKQGNGSRTPHCGVLCSTAEHGEARPSKARRSNGSALLMIKDQCSERLCTAQFCTVK